MTVSDLLVARWRTGELTGAAKHQLVVRVRPGHVRRDYMAKSRIDGGRLPRVTPTVFEGQNTFPWQGLWTPVGDWVTLPNVQSAKYARGFDQNGSASLTVVMDNVAFVGATGDAGLFHNIERGFFSPARGIVLSTRPALWDATGWTDALNGGYQIELWEGYGPDGDPSVTPLDYPNPTTHSCAPANAAINRTFTGIIEVCDLESHPDHITLTARDFGILFTDQRVQGTNKAAEIVAPVIFADRRKTLGEIEVQAPLPPSAAPDRVAASSEFDAHGGFTGWITNMHPNTIGYESLFSLNGWWSAPQSAPTATQWLQMTLPKGDYTEFTCIPGVAGMTMWASVYVGPGVGVVDGLTHAEGWVNDGSGMTPDGIPFLGVWHDVPPDGDCHAGSALPLSHDLKLPEHSILRLTFTHLAFEDPIYDSAPPFPYDFFEKMMNIVRAARASPWKDWLAGDRRAIEHAQENLAYAERQLALRDDYFHQHPDLREWIPFIWMGYLDYDVSQFAEGPRVRFWGAKDEGENTGLWDMEQDIHALDGLHDWHQGGPDRDQFVEEVNHRKARLRFAEAGLAADLKAQAKEMQGDIAAVQAYTEADAMMRLYDAIWNAHKVANPGYYAVVNSMSAYYIPPTDEEIPGKKRIDPSWAPVNAHGWVLTDDAADVIVMIFMWLGFKEWDVDPFGWHLINPMQWGSDKFFIDVVNDMLAQGNYIFSMGPPSDDDRSIGKPRFKRQAATTPPANIISLSDADLLETAEIKWDLSNLPGQLRYRGNPVPTDSHGDPTGDPGDTWEEDLVLTYQAVYTPPWAGERYTPLGGNPVTMPNRTAGVMRHFTQTEGVNVTIGLGSDAECLFACVLAAIQYAIGMCTGQLQIPGRPGITLNDQLDVIEEATAINSRMWVASVESEHTLGPNGKWVMVIGGSYLDTEDMELLRSDYLVAYIAMLAARGASDCSINTGSSAHIPIIYNNP